MNQRSRAVIWLFAATCVGAYMLSGIGVDAQQHPDFTGVWTTYNEPGAAPAGRGGGPPLPMKDEARRQVERYQAIVKPTGDTPGGYCLGTGMPG
ncbi:MAG TPA: hypothetical protein VFS23_08610, partial [Vicinamibacterales bacterium]|nr:hypothetical protein [Vicinamibacterales bacterium]